MNENKAIIAGVVFLVLLVSYIVAKVRSKKDLMVITANGWDMAMLLVCPVAIFVAWCWGFDHPLNDVQTVCMVIAGLCFTGTVIMSIVHNAGSFINIVLSILAKLFIIYLTLVAIFLLFTALIISILLTFMRSHDEDDDIIILKYDRFLHSYVGYRYTLVD